MRKIFLKTVVSFLLIVFLMQPIMEVIFNVGKANAATFSRVITGSSYAELNSKIGPDENYVITKREDKYRVVYTKSFPISHVWECYLKWFDKGQTISSSVGFARIMNRGYDYKGTSNHFLTNISKHNESYYDVRVTVEEECETGFRTDTNFPKVTLSGNYGYYSPIKISEEMVVKEYHVIESRFTANVYKRANTSTPTQTSAPAQTSAPVVENYNPIYEEPDDSYYYYEDNYDDTSYGYIEENNEPEMIYQDYEEPDWPHQMPDNAKRLYIRHLYNTILKREADNERDISYWMLFPSVSELTDGLIFCGESYERNKMEEIPNEQFIRNCYRFILGRDASIEEVDSLNYMLERGLSRTNAIKKIVNLQEFYDKMMKNAVEVNMDSKLLSIIYSKVKAADYSVVKTSDTSIVMYEEEINKLTELNINGKEDIDIKGLSTFKNLQNISAAVDNISNIEELAKLPNLKVLNLDYNKIDDYSFLWQIKSLEELHIQDNSLTNEIINGNIDKLTNLKKLYIANNNIKSLIGIDSLPNLKELYADSNQIMNVGNLNNMQLDKVSIKNNNLGDHGILKTIDLPDIFKLAKADGSKLYTSENIECTNCRIENDKIIIEDIGKNAKIVIKGGNADKTQFIYKNNADVVTVKDEILAERLRNISELNISEIENVNGEYKIYIDKEKVLSVESLDLSASESDQRKISNIEGLSKFENLKSLNLNSNKITDFTELAKLSDLETLSVRFNNLSDLKSMSELRNLIQLDISNNYITDVSPISKLTNLNALLVGNNNIQNNLTPLSKLSKLAVLDITNNNVSDISALSNLKLGELYASYNSIKDLSNIDKNGLEKLELKNNIINLEANEKMFDMPEIVQYSINKYGRGANLELYNCNIINNKLVLNDGNKKGQVVLLGEDCEDTEINLQDTENVQPPQLSVSTKLSEDQTSMTVEITSNKKIQKVYGWGLNEQQNKLTRVFYFNVSNMAVVVKDLYGNETVQVIGFTGVKNQAINDLTVVYGDTKPTNRDVEVTVTASEDLYEIGEWKYKDNNKSLSRKFSDNDGFKVVQLMTQRQHDNHGNPITIDLGIANIDKESPQCQVEYSTQEPTKSSVRATIWADEEIQLMNAKQSLVSNVTKVGDNGKTMYGCTLYFGNNGFSQIAVMDNAGNPAIVDVEVNNIDNFVQGLKLESSGLFKTNKEDTIKVTADEKIKINSEQSTEASAFDKLKVLAQKNINNNDKMFKIAGDLTTAPVMDGYADVQNELYVGKNKIIKLAENAVENPDYSNELTYQISGESFGTIGVNDEVNNTDVILVNTNNIDKTAPMTKTTYTKNADGSILVTINSVEEIRKTEDLIDWTFSDDCKTISKTYNSYGFEKIKIYDLAGNLTNVDIDTDEISVVDYEVTLEEVARKDQLKVTIKSSKELQEVSGWTLAEDKKSMSKVMFKKEEEKVVINDLNGNASVVKISLVAQKQNTDVEADANKNAGEDNTQSTEILPQTGNYYIFKGILTIIIAALAFVGIKKYQKNGQIK